MVLAKDNQPSQVTAKTKFGALAEKGKPKKIRTLPGLTAGSAQSNLTQALGQISLLPGSRPFGNNLLGTDPSAANLAGALASNSGLSEVTPDAPRNSVKSRKFSGITTSVNKSVLREMITSPDSRWRKILPPEPESR